MRRTSPGPTPIATVVAAPIDSDAALAAAIEALAAIDPHPIAHLVEAGGPPVLRRRAPGFEGLAQIVVGQQLSTASAGAIFARLTAAVRPFDPQVLGALPDAVLKECGLSVQKIRTLRSIAAAILAGTLPLDRLTGMTADAAMGSLTSIGGIGPWTAEVFLLFCLGHADAWPAGDLALQEAARLLLGLETRPDTAALRIIGERWRPYRGAAAYLLWGYYRVRKNREGPAMRQDPA